MVKDHRGDVWQSGFLYSWKHDEAHYLGSVLEEFGFWKNGYWEWLKQEHGSNLKSEPYSCDEVIRENQQEV